MQVLIYAHSVTTRLQYICRLILEEQLGLNVAFTDSTDVFEKSAEPLKINYSNQTFLNCAYFHIQNASLLFENNIRIQDIECSKGEDFKYFFKAEKGDLGFDIFAASFYLVSRYEEYLPHQKDMYGRFAHENAIAFREGFLDKPIVNIWIKHFAKALLQKYPALNIQLPPFRFIPTYDIDIAYAFKHKGFIRNFGGLLKSPSLKRLKVLLGSESDPYDVYDTLHELHSNHHLHPIYFLLVAEHKSVYDKNNSPKHAAMRRLIAEHGEKYTLGIHPSWKSFENPATIEREKQLLEEISAKPISISRQHYIKMHLPDTYQHLIDAGITQDYSMGYGSINGFRASIASPFYWFNLKTNESTALQIFPFCYMDANSYFEQRYSADEAAAELKYYFKACRDYHGCFTPIFHNNILGTEKMFSGWAAMYASFLKSITSQLQQ